jgi:radical SAM superfamily enzyme YgiQ (UPF0313 family)
MKILFSNPVWWTKGERGEIRAGIRAGSRWPFTVPTNSRYDEPAAHEYLPMPMFLGFAASWCQRAFPDAEVVLRDSLARRESYETYLNYICTWKPDYVVIETATPSWEHDKQVCRLIKEAHPAARIIITGTITTTRGKEIADMGYWAVMGEYEKGVVEAITHDTTALIGGNAKNQVYHRLLASDEMNDAPIPMYDEPFALSYYDACPTGQQSPELSVWTTRGCSFRCCFCSWPATMTNNDPDGSGKRSVRFYKPEFVENWIRARLEKNPGIKSIRLDDDTMNFGDKHTLGITAAMKRIGLPWSAMCRADTVKLETWQAMKDAGCFGVKIGMESGSQHVIDSIVNKKLDLADIETRILPHLKSIGLKVHTTWTVGLPGETPAQAQETVQMIQRLYDNGLHQTHQLSGTATIEGTPLDAIARGEHLKAYPDATREGFAVTGDGQAKIEHMSRALQ